MFLVSLLCFALFSQAIGQDATATSAEEDQLLAMAESTFAAQFPLPYKIIEFIRVMLGIAKDKMMKFGMKAFEVLTELQELWELLVDMFRKDPPKARVGRANQQYTGEIPINRQYYYGY